jgi:uncharacterized repeat protein (TIGR03847 family)
LAQGIDLDPLDNLAVGTVGPPGQRRFFLQASGGGRSLTLGCEKVQVQALLERIHEALEAQGAGEEEFTAGPASPPAEPLQADWEIAELGVGFHEPTERYVIVVRPGTAEGEASAEDTVRLWATPDRLRAFAVQAEAVLSQGRQTCPRCGLPMDPGGHPCPMSNGAHPIF